jgi:hypothetical protein
MSSSSQVHTNQVVATAIDYIVTGVEGVVAVTDTSAPRNVTLPPASDVGSIACVVIKDQSGGASPTNPITISASGGTVDGQPNIKIQAPMGFVAVYSDGKAWYTRSEGGSSDGLSASTYNATTAANWSGNAPATVKAALDRIATKIGPIA